MEIKGITKKFLTSDDYLYFTCWTGGIGKKKNLRNKAANIKK